MTIVFFLPVIIRDEHRRIYPLEQLENEGHRVIILDATKYFNVYHSTVADDFIKDHIVECKSKEDFINFRHELGDDAVIFVSNDLYMSMAYDVLNILIKKQDQLLSASTRYTAAHYKYPNLIKKKCIELIRILHNLIPLHLFKYYYRKIKKIYTPDYFLGSTKFLTSIKTYISVKSNKIICIHSDDINYAYRPLKKILDPNKKIGVFVDQMIPYFNGRNPDIHNAEIEKEYKIDYYRNLVASLKRLKLIFELDDIVIALHPEANLIREEIDDKYSPFKTFTAVSHELIKDSNMVFGHFSTAIGMAVFYNKPIILFRDQKMMNYPGRNNHIESYSHELGVKIINTDSNFFLNKEDIEVNHELYNHYIKKFLKENSYQGNSYYYAINRIIKDLQ